MIRPLSRLKSCFRPLAGACLLLAALFSVPALAQEGDEGKLRSPNLYAALDEQGSAKVIVLLKGYDTFKGIEFGLSPIFRDAVQTSVAAGQEALLARIDPAEVQVGLRFQNIPGLALRVTRKGLDELLASERVAVVEEDREVSVHTSQGIELINPGRYRDTYWGGGVSIAIVDTGVDYSHEQLGGGGFPNAKVIGGYDFGDDDPDPMDCHGHGTSVAGVAAGEAVALGDYTGGVAPLAKVYALKIVSGCSGMASESSIIAAWDWAVTHRDDDPANPIKVVSTSFGGGLYTSVCDGQQVALAQAAANAVANGISVVVSAGNDGSCSALASPACLSDTISVGAVYDADVGAVGFCVDSSSCVGELNYSCAGLYACWETSTAAGQVACYSNSADFLDLLAPANNAYTPALGGGFRSFTGTSAACPYVSGAIAVIQSWSKATNGAFLSPAEVKSRLVDNGTPVTDPKSGLTTPLIQIAPAIENGGPAATALEVIFGLAQGEEAGFLFSIPAGASSLTVKLTNVSGNPDLYTAQGYIPTTSSYDCRSTNGSGQTETCSHQSPAAGDWFAVVRGETAAACTLTVTYTTSDQETAAEQVIESPALDAEGAGGP